MPIDFPNSPAVGDSFTAGSTSWVWDGTVWNVAGGVVINTVDGLLDVNTAGAVADDFLKYDGAQWVPDTIPTINALDDIGDVVLDTPILESGQALKYDGTSWTNNFITLGDDTKGDYLYDVAAGTGISVAHSPNEGSTATVSLDASLDNLSDVTISAPAAGESLSYNGSGWVNSPGMPSGSITQFAGSTAPSGWLTCDGTAVSRTTYAALFAVVGTTYGEGDGSTTFALPNLKGRTPVGVDPTQTEFDALGETGGAKTHLLIVSEMPSHSHLQDAHNHTQNSHNHTQNAHGHSINDPGHNHSVPANWGGAYNTVGVQLDPTTYANPYYYNVTTSNGTGISVNNATATNQATTAINQATTATNQNTGGGEAHNNLQPYIVLNYIIKA